MTLEERVIDGLQKRLEAPLDIQDTGEEKGRGVFSKEKIGKGEYLCEYRTYQVYPIKEKPHYDAIYDRNDEGSFTIEAPIKGRKFCFDATRKFHQIGRYLNHSRAPNVRPHRPVWVRGKWRIGMVSLREIDAGEELTWDYGDRSSSFEWLKGKGRKRGSGPKRAPHPKRHKSDDEEEEEELAPVKKKGSQEHYRRSRYCPVPGCSSQKPLKKISNHLKTFHQDLTPQQHQLFLKSARYATRTETVDKVRRINPPRNVPKITSFFQLGAEQGEVPPPPPPPPPPVSPTQAAPSPGSPSHEGPPPSQPSSSDSDVEIITTPSTSTSSVGTRKYPRFAPTNPYLQRLKAHFISRHGKGKSESEATQVVTDISKFLFFYNPKQICPDGLLERKVLDAYVSKLEADGVGPSGITSKLTRLQQGLDFHIIDAELDVAEDQRYRKAQVVKTSIKNWKSTLSKEISKTRSTKLEALSEEAPSFESISCFTENLELRDVYQDVLQDIEQGREVSEPHLSHCTAWVAGRTLYFNAQRPGAVINLTLEEAEEAKSSEEGGQTYLVAKVKQHKTSAQGVAKLVFKGEQIRLLTQYINVIRPKIEGAANCPYVFVDGGGQISNLSRLVYKTGRLFGVTPPTATESRKLTATEGFKKLESRERTKLAKHMSHSIQVSEACYTAARGVKEATEGFELVEKLRQGDSTEMQAPKPKTRKKFSDTENELIKTYFDSHIKDRVPPRMAECQEFLEGHKLDRTPKDIYDKVRNLFK